MLFKLQHSIYKYIELESFMRYPYWIQLVLFSFLVHFLNAGNNSLPLTLPLTNSSQTPFEKCLLVLKVIIDLPDWNSTSWSLLPRKRPLQTLLSNHCMCSQHCTRLHQICYIWLNSLKSINRGFYQIFLKTPFQTIHTYICTLHLVIQ